MIICGKHKEEMNDEADNQSGDDDEKEMQRRV